MSFSIWLTCLHPLKVSPSRSAIWLWSSPSVESCASGRNARASTALSSFRESRRMRSERSAAKAEGDTVCSWLPSRYSA